MIYSVLDVETTGFSKSVDRIIEVAIVKIDSTGNIIDTFESVINPNRDVGPIHIHGLTATSVFKAPHFSEVAHSVLSILNNSVIVSHNKNFDLGFLNSEFQRANIELPELGGICTLQLSKYLFPELPSRKLEVLCDYLDILVENAHEAMSDCKATMQLFLKMQDSFISEYGEKKFKELFIEENPLSLNIPHPAKKLEYKRIDADIELRSEASRMANLLNRIPDFYRAIDYNISEYLNLLDDILEDRIISVEEYSEIEKFTINYKISSKDLENIHEEYYRRLVRFYLSDNLLSNSEILDLTKVAELLQIDQNKRKLIIELEKADLKIHTDDELIETTTYIGKSVCFTGQLISKYNGQLITREVAHSLAIEKGLMVKKGVTKSLDMLIVSDPKTQSGKGKKARQYGTKVIAEPVFWKKIGIKVE